MDRTRAARRCFLGQCQHFDIAGMILQHFQPAGNDSQDVAEVMCDLAGNLSEYFHLLRLTQFALDDLAVLGFLAQSFSGLAPGMKRGCLPLRTSRCDNPQHRQGERSASKECTVENQVLVPGSKGALHAVAVVRISREAGNFLKRVETLTTKNRRNTANEAGIAPCDRLHELAGRWEWWRVGIGRRLARDNCSVLANQGGSGTRLAGRVFPEVREVRWQC